MNPTTPPRPVSRTSKASPRGRSAGLIAALLAAFAGSAEAQLIYTEDFDTPGEGTRYTTQGGGAVEGLPTTGPAYWARNV
ncbi:MAG: hypothetical protein JNL97_03050, partial [Verrucomicrobiales bacterium]|nr:hypothetical protein [Verrucomicrobiales bacterium]